MKQREKGFSLLEVLIGLAIMAIIVVPITMTTTMIVRSSRQAAAQNAVLPQVQNAGYWISRDVQIASGITLDDDPNGNGFPLALDIPTDDDPNHDYGIEYLFDGNKLKREVYDSSQILVSETFIADRIDTDNTIFSLVDIDAGHYSLTVTAAGDVAGATRSYEIKQRISLSYCY